MKQKFTPVIVQSIGSITAAFALVAALAWNEAVKSLISNFIPQGQGTLSLFVYALVVTAVAVLIGSRLMKVKERFEENEEIQE
ncbi:MAG: DUF5654 family protein [bacterium]|nr:DUF5654 family protein [bacterium]